MLVLKELPLLLGLQETDFCISHRQDSFFPLNSDNGEGVCGVDKKGAMLHTCSSQPTQGAHYWAIKRLSPLFCPCLDLSCEFSVGVYGEESKLPVWLRPQF